MHKKILLRESPYTHPWGSTPLYKPYTYVPPQRVGYAKATCGLIVESNSLAVFNSSYSPTYCSYELPDYFLPHIMIHLFLYMYYQILYVKFLSEHCIYFMIVSFNSWCHVCNRFYQLNKCRCRCICCFNSK